VEGRCRLGAQGVVGWENVGFVLLLLLRGEDCVCSGGSGGAVAAVAGRAGVAGLAAGMGGVAHFRDGFLRCGERLG